MSRYTNESGYDVGVQYPTTRPGLTPTEVRQVSGALAEAPAQEIIYPPLGGTVNNYPLADGDAHLFTNGTITGFAGPRAGFQWILNIDAGLDLTLVNNSASSSTFNRIRCHTGANIALGPGESVIIRYDFRSGAWRTIGFS